MKRITLILFTLLLIMQVFSEEGSHDYGILKIGCEPDYPPFCLVNDCEEADGFSIDMIKASLDAVNIQYEIKVDLWDTIKRELAEGKLDALPLVGRTPEREPLFDFTFPYASLHGAIFTRTSDISIDSIEDLKDKKIAVMKGDNAEEYIRRDSLSNDIVLTDSFEEAFRNLSSGKSDAVITQRVMGLQLLQDLKINNVTPLDIHLDRFKQEFCFAVTEGDKELLEKLNEGLAIIISNGTYDELHQKWFTPIFKHGLLTYEKIVIVLKFLIPSILFISLILLFIMRREIRKKTQTLKLTIKEMEVSQKLLIQNEEKFRSYVNNAPIGIFVTDEKGKYIEANEAASETTGYSNEELLSMHVTDFQAESKHENSKHFDELKGTGKNSFVKEFRKKSGETGIWHVFAVKLSDNRFLGFTMEVTNQIKTAQLLEEKNTMLQQLFDHMNKGFSYHKVIVEEGKPVDYIFLETNKSFIEMMEFNQLDLIGKRVTEVIPETRLNRGGGIEVFGKVAITGESIRFESFSKRLRKWFQVSAYSPQKGYFAAMYTDITNRKNIEKELEKYKDELEAKVKERTSELEARNSELKQYNQVFVGREFRIKQLRTKVKNLEEEIDNLKNREKS